MITSIFGLPSTLYKLKEDTAQNILIRLFFIGKTVSEFEIAKIFNSVHQLETLVLKSSSRDKFELATTQYAEKVKNYEAYEKTVSAYLNHLDHVGMISYCSAVITSRNIGKYRMKELFGLPKSVLFKKDLQEFVKDFFNYR